MNTLSKASIVLLVILLAGVGLLVWKVKVGGQHSEGLTKLTKSDMETIFKDAPPMALKRLAEDKELKKKQIEEIKQFLAVAEEARATGFANKEEVKKDLEEIRMTVTAVSYDKEMNKDKENLPPFSSITKENVDAFFGQAGNQEKFDKLIKEQIEKAKKDGRIPENFEPQPEQIEQAKEQYAKVRISYEGAKAAWAGLNEEFKKTTELQIKLQQAQYLEQMYSKDVIAPKVKVSDAEVDKYLAENPEEGKILTEKKTKAEEILKRALAGEDFAKLATETTEDPGSKKDGGLYKDVTKGAMVKEFEEAALSLQPGQVADRLIESKYGYHIIKLEKKGTKKVADTAAGENKTVANTGGTENKEEETYDARHILISTMGGADPNNPMAQPQPLKEQIKAKLEQEKEKKILDDIMAKHKIEIEDFQIKVPEMPAGQEGMPPGMPQGQNGQPQLDQKQMEELQKRIKEMQEQQKNAPKGKDAPKPAGKDGK